MDIRNIVNKIVNIPLEYKRGNKSFAALLKASGYLELQDEVNEADIVSALAEYQNCINEWVIFSDNKRTDSGWFIQKGSNAQCVVGYFPTEIGIPENIFTNEKLACAFFIKKEIESIKLKHTTRSRMK